MKRLLLAVALLGAVAASAQDTVDTEAVRLSRLAMAAFECVHYTVDTDEQTRLFQLGHKAGAAFLDIAEKRGINDATRGNLAVLWRFLSGPSVDFVLGRLYEQMADKAADELGSNTDLWDGMRPTKYGERNCGLLVGQPDTKR